MVRALTFLSLLAACGGALPVRGGDETTVLQATCVADADCPGGMVCEGCNGPHDAVCIPGCRTDSQCQARHVCRGPVQCTTCPCPPGWCELDPCRDIDGDGFAFTTDPTVTCSIPKNDCNDGNANVRPGATEWCSNGIDDDCDGKADSYDESCQRCVAESVSCVDGSECRPNRLGTTQCKAGCCASCPAIDVVRCSSTQWQVGSGLDGAGCLAQPKCIERASCPSSGQWLCGTNYASYRSACELQLMGATQLHVGSCQWNEGLPCNRADGGVQGTCPNAQYCRADATLGGRCTLLGACLVDADCPAGFTDTLCPDGKARVFTCERNACIARCD